MRIEDRVKLKSKQETFSQLHILIVCYLCFTAIVYLYSFDFGFTIVLCRAYYFGASFLCIEMAVEQSSRV